MEDLAAVWRALQLSWNNTEKNYRKANTLKYEQLLNLGKWVSKCSFSFYIGFNCFVMLEVSWKCSALEKNVQRKFNYSEIVSQTVSGGLYVQVLAFPLSAFIPLAKSVAVAEIMRWGFGRPGRAALRGQWAQLLSACRPDSSIVSPNSILGVYTFLDVYWHFYWSSKA